MNSSFASRRRNNRWSLPTKIPHPAPLKPRLYKNLNVLAPVHPRTKAAHNNYIRNETAALHRYHHDEYQHKEQLLNQLPTRHLFSIPEEDNESDTAGNELMNLAHRHYSTVKARELNTLRKKQANRSRRMEKGISHLLYNRRTQKQNRSPLPAMAPRNSYHNRRESPLKASEIKYLRKTPSMRRSLYQSLPLMEDPVLSSYAPPHVSQAVNHHRRSLRRRKETLKGLSRRV